MEMTALVLTENMLQQRKHGWWIFQEIFATELFQTISINLEINRPFLSKRRIVLQQLYQAFDNRPDVKKTPPPNFLVPLSSSSSSCHVDCCCHENVTPPLLCYNATNVLYTACTIIARWPPSRKDILQWYNMNYFHFYSVEDSRVYVPMKHSHQGLPLHHHRESNHFVDWRSLKTRTHSR